MIPKSSYLWSLRVRKDEENQARSDSQRFLDKEDESNSEMAREKDLSEHYLAIYER